METMTERKSIGVDVNWGVRFTDADKADRFVRHVCAELAARMKQVGCSVGGWWRWWVAVLVVAGGCYWYLVI